jgi:hypothetical protein
LRRPVMQHDCPGFVVMTDPRAGENFPGLLT